MGATLSFPNVDLQGRVAVVTGGNAGVGYETAKALAVMGAHTVIACRSSERATAAVSLLKQEISDQFPDKSATIEWMLLDLSSFRSTKDFTVAFREKNLPLHILINNAGISWNPLCMTEDGYESHFQVNHLSHFLLTLELLPLMLDSAHSSGDGRIVFVSSMMHSSGEFTPGNLNAERSYSRTKFYSNSKLFMLMTAYALQRKLGQVGITVSALHPGFVKTDITLKGTADSKAWSYFFRTSRVLFAPMMRELRDGAATSINCAVNPELNSQQCFYYDSCQVKESSAVSRDIQLQEQLWEISVNIVKDNLNPDVLEKFGAPQSSRCKDACEQGQEVTGVDEQSPDGVLHEQHHSGLAEGAGQPENGAKAADQENTSVEDAETTSDERKRCQVEANDLVEDQKEAINQPED